MKSALHHYRNGTGYNHNRNDNYHKVDELHEMNIKKWQINSEHARENPRETQQKCDWLIWSMCVRRKKTRPTEYAISWKMMEQLRKKWSHLYILMMILSVRVWWGDDTTNSIPNQKSSTETFFLRFCYFSLRFIEFHCKSFSITQHNTTQKVYANSF